MNQSSQKQPITKTSVALKGVIAGSIAFLLTLSVALMSNSLAIWADLVATFIGVLIIFIAWSGFRKVEKPAQRSSDYGFGKFESISSLAMAALMTVSSACIMVIAVVRFMDPVAVIGIGVPIAMLTHIVYGVIHGYLLLKTVVLQKRENTPLLASQKLFYVIKFGSNALMLASLIISYFLNSYRWAMYVDPVTATIIAGMIILNVTKIIRHSALDLLDFALAEQSQLLIMRSLAHHFDRYEDIRDIRTRKGGGKVYVELFIEFDGDLKHSQVMETVHSLQTEIVDLLKCDEVWIIPVSAKYLTGETLAPLS